MRALYLYSLLLLALSASAAPPPLPRPNNDDEDNGEERVDVNSKREQGRETLLKRKADPMARTVYDSKDLDKYPDSSLIDILRRLPGVDTGQGNGRSRLRGFDKAYSQILIDGEPMASGSQDGQTQLDRIPVEMVERIELIRTPGAALPGDGSNGAVNIVLKGVSRQSDDKLTSSLGQISDHNTGSLQLQKADKVAGGQMQWSMGAAHRADQGSSRSEHRDDTLQLTDSDRKQHDSSSNEINFAPRWQWQNNAARLTIEPSLFGSESNGSEQAYTRENLPDVPVLSAMQTDNDSRRALWRLSARWWQSLGDGELQARVGTDNGHNQQNQSEFMQLANDQPALALKQSDSSRDHNISASSNWRRIFEGVSAEQSQDFSSGIDLRKRRYHSTRTIEFTSLPFVEHDDEFSADETRISLWLQDQWSINAKQVLIPGWRREWSRRRADDDDTLFHYDQAQISDRPSLHYLYRWTDDTNVRLSAIRSQRMTRLSELNPQLTLATGADAGTIDNPDRGGNPALLPESARSYQAGIEHFFDGDKALMSLSLAHRDVTDLVEQHISLQANGRYIKRPENIAQATIDSLELEWKWPLWQRQITLNGNYRLLRARLQDSQSGDTRNAREKPPGVWNFGVDWTPSRSAWETGFSATHTEAINSHALDADGNDEQYSEDATTALDAYLRWRESKRLRWSFNLRNVLQTRQHTDSYRTLLDGSTVSDQQQWNNTRISYTLGLQISL